MEIWYYAFNGAQQGPVSQDALVQMLRTGQLPLDSMVWRDGMADWIAARNVPELAAAASSPNTQNAASPIAVGYAGPAYAYNAVQIQYAGFWLRFAAYIIDSLVLLVPSFALGMIIGLMFATVGHARPGQAPDPAAVGIACCAYIAAFGMTWLYYALMESSSKMATLGKLACGLRVVDLSGQRISFGQASGRFFGKIVSGLMLCIGFMMAGWTRQKQALHDKMASTLVIRR